MWIGYEYGVYIQASASTTNIRDMYDETKRSLLCFRKEASNVQGQYVSNVYIRFREGEYAFRYRGRRGLWEETNVSNEKNKSMVGADIRLYNIALGGPMVATSKAFNSKTRCDRFASLGQLNTIIAGNITGMP